jgi:hypothetical protein
VKAGSLGSSLSDTDLSERFMKIHTNGATLVGRARARAGAEAAERQRLPAKLICPSWLIFRNRVKPLPKKYFCFYFSEDVLASNHPAPARGTLRPIVTKRGAGCDGRGLARFDDARGRRTAKSRGPGAPTLASSRPDDLSAGDGG